MTLPIAQSTTPSATPLISETFYSLQGEGKLTGMPSFFIRFSGCNLRCRWCDTPYASWNPEGRKRPLEELVHEAAASGTRHVVLTGGEPMMFDSIEPLSQQLRACGIHITIETAGTIFRDPSRVACDLMSISPKLRNSTPRDDPRDPGNIWSERHESRRLNVDVLQRLIDSWPQRQLKFVVSGDADLPEIKDLLGQLRNWEAGDVLLMPEGVTVPSPETKAWLTQVCLREGWRYCPRLHIELFGNTRGT